MNGMKWLALGALLAACGAAAPGRGRAPVELARLLPAPASMPGWSTAEGPVEYSPATLFEYLDGGAERYLGYGFRGLLHVRYQPGSGSQPGVTLDLFDMGSELAAFGIYSSARPPVVAPREWGVEGYRSATVAAAWKAGVYIHAEADEERPELVATLERLVAGTSEKITGSCTSPAILAALPPDGLVPRSQRFVASDLLGWEFLPGGFLARYRVGEQGGELFFSELGSRAAAARAIATLHAHHVRAGRIEGAVRILGSAGFSFSERSLGAGTVLASGRFVAGVYGELPLAVRERLLRELVARLASLPANG
jgi:hypothetical protein